MLMPRACEGPPALKKNLVGRERGARNRMKLNVTKVYAAD